MREKLKQWHRKKFLDKIYFEDEKKQIAWINFINGHRIDREDKIIKKNVPPMCYGCPVLGECRDMFKTWKTKSGCWFIEK